MDKTLRSILWILVSLVLLSSFTAGWFFIAKEELSDEYVSLEDLFKTSMDRLNREITSLDEENVDLKARLDVVSMELSSLETRNEDLEYKYKKLSKEKEALNKDLARAKKGKYFLEKRLKDVESDYFVSDLLRQKVVMEVELKKLKEAFLPKELHIEELKGDRKDLESQLSKAYEENLLAKNKFEDATKVSEILSRDLLKEKDRNVKAKGEFEARQAENQILKLKLAELESTANRFNRLVAEKENADLRFSQLKRILKSKLAEIESTVDEFNRLVIEKGNADLKFTQLRKELEQKDQELERIKLAFREKSYQSEKLRDLRLAQLRKELEQKDQELERIKLAFSEKARQSEEIRAEAYHAPSEVELPPIFLQNSQLDNTAISSPIDRINMGTSLKGRIVAVNSEHNFVVIDMGRQNGIETGEEFEIYRGQAYIGLVEVIQMRDRISACDIKDVKGGRSLKIDDMIVAR